MNDLETSWRQLLAGIDAELRSSQRTKRPSPLALVADQDQAEIVELSCQDIICFHRCIDELFDSRLRTTAFGVFLPSPMRAECWLWEDGPGLWLNASLATSQQEISASACYDRRDQKRSPWQSCSSSDGDYLSAAGILLSRACEYLGTPG